MNSTTPRAVALFHNRISAWLVLAAGFLMTAAAWYVSGNAVRTRALERFEFRTEQVRQDIRDRMIVYEQVLWGGVGLFTASGFPEGDQWRRYVATLDLEEHWPGIQGIGVSIPVAPDEVDQLVRDMRESWSPDFQIAPEGQRDEYSAIVYLEPLDWRNRRAVGFDMWSNEVRREAMARARDTGEAATSGMITLVQETDENTQAGFLTYLPVYRDGVAPETVAERREALIAWVYAPFRIGDLLAGVQATHVEEVAFELFDGTELTQDHQLYDGTPNQTLDDHGELERTVEIPLQGRTWTVRFRSSIVAMVGQEASQPALVAMGGLIIDFLLFYVIGSLALVQKRATRMANEMTSELRQARDELESQNELLEQNAEVLERSNRELREFAYAASHDLQEPLRSVASFAELLEHRYYAQFDDDGKAWLDYLSEGARRMSALVSGLLDYSRQDGVEVAFQRVSLDLALDRALANLTRAVEEKEACIERASLPEVDGNLAQLSQLFQNLVANALKYVPAGVTPRVQIFCEERPDAHLVHFRDNGIGIDPEHHERIFQIFKRLHARAQYPGTGIGLATCRKIAERHGGSVGVDSVQGEGATFTVVLPKHHDTESHETSGEGAEPDRSPGAAPVVEAVPAGVA